MLTRFHKVLIGLLAAQLVLVAIVFLRGDDRGAQKEQPLLAGFDAGKVTRIQVLSSAAAPAGPSHGGAAAAVAAKPVDVVKRDASWVVASAFDYPVDPAKVTDVLTPIAKLAAAAPIATQASRHKQLRVADDDFERKLVITSGGKDITLFIGSAIGARRVAVRLGGSDNVYSVTGITASTAGNEPRQWVDPSYVKIPADEVAKVTVKREATTLTLARPAAAAAAAGDGSGSAAPPAPPAPEHWNVAVGDAPIVLAAGESLDDAAVDRLVTSAAAIDLTAPADPKRDATKPTATITIERKASGTASPAPTVIDVIADGSSYWVHDRSQARAVLVDKARLDGVVEAGRDKLVKQPPPPPPAVSPPSAGPGVPPRPGPGPARTPG